MKFNFNDGGRTKYFKANNVGDCVTRAVAIASGRDYKEIYDAIAKATKNTPRNGVNTNKAGFKRLMVQLGFRWVACMGIGTGCKVHLSADELPAGRLVCSVSRHYTAVIDGVINDTYDCSRDGERCVYGYWIYEGGTQHIEEQRKKNLAEAKTLLLDAMKSLARAYALFEDDAKLHQKAVKAYMEIAETRQSLTINK